MHRIGTSVVVFAAVASAAAAQEPAQPQALVQEPKLKVGIGMALNPTALFVSGNLTGNNLPLTIPTGLSNIIVPLRFRQVTLEPEIGLFKTHATSSSQFGSSDYTATNLRVALGLLVHLKVRGNLQPYLGPRVGIIKSSTSQSFTGGNPSEDHETDWVYTAALGAQYFFSPHFSLGGEAQVSYVTYGQPTSQTQGSTDQSLTGTSAMFMLRWFF